MTGSDALDTRLAQLEARAADGKLAPGGCAIELCRGIRAFAEGDNDGAVRLLEPAISELARIGGSHAQRQLWEDTLIVAYLRAGHGDKAARRISARLDCRPSARDEAWSRQAQRKTEGGAEEAAEAFREIRCGARRQIPRWRPRGPASAPPQALRPRRPA